MIKLNNRAFARGKTGQHRSARGNAFPHWWLAPPPCPLKGKRLTTFCASLALLQNVFAVHRRAIPQPSARRAVKLKNPPAVRPVHPKNPFPQPFYTTCRHQAATTLGPKVRQPSHRRCVPRGVFSALDCLTFCVIINTSNKLNI